jgi:hypothetical protein
MNNFCEKEIKTWEDFLRLPHLSEDTWIYRGQSEDWPLKTSLERACERSIIELKDAPSLERSLVTNFRRRYDGHDQQFVLSDTLYCLALMQHHGAPTRLLDWTYSPYVAFYFALEFSFGSSVVWCVNQTWWSKKARAIMGERRYALRNKYETRNDESFVPLYMTDKPYRMVGLENPFFFNQRLNIQQGVFLCSGNVAVSFEENLKALEDYHHAGAVLKIRCGMNGEDRLRALKELHKMNIHRESLFPGLDGFAQALSHRLWMYQKIHG